MTSADVGADFVERARRLAPLLDERADEAERVGRLTDDVVEAFHRERLYGVWTPASLGGAELDPVSSLELLEHLAAADPSAGWVHMAAALCVGTAGAYLGDDAVEELFGGERFPVIHGQGTRPGTLVPQDGGFLLSGSWSFASGIRHATHVHTLAVVEETAEPRICVLPVEQATLIDNWDVLGLRATGSIDYTIDSVFVPEAYTHVGFVEGSSRGGGLFQLGVIGMAVIGHAGWALGVARRLLEELAGLAREKVGRPGAIADSSAFQERYAIAEGKYRAARALVFETWRDVGRSLDSGDPLSVRQHTMIRFVPGFATTALHEVSNVVYLASGTTGLRSGTIQRLYRDAHAGTQHLIVSSPVMQACGRELAGLAPGESWRFLELRDPLEA
jgi:alkylation response protein AidB-like acyl-CoA dehydrogenase